MIRIAAPLTRRALLIAAGACACTHLAGCGSARPGVSGVITLRVVGPGEPDLVSGLLPQFEQAHPGVHVQYSPAGPGSRQALATALLTGTGPDVFWDDDPSPYLGTPLVADLAPLAHQTGLDLGDFGPSVLAAYGAGGGLFMLPRTVSPSAYAARTDVLANAGVAVPGQGWTSDDLAAVWRRVGTGGRVTGGRLDWSPGASYYLNGWGAHLVAPADRTRCALATEGAVACGQWMWDRLVGDGTAQGPQGQSPAASFWNGTLAMQTVTASAAARFAAGATTSSWTLVPFPTWPVGPSTLATADFYAVAATSAHSAEAFALVAFLTGKDWQQAAATADLVPPSRLSLWDAFLTALAAAAPPLAHQPLTVFSTPVRQDWARPPETFRFQPQALAVLDGYWQRIFGSAATLGVQAGFQEAAADTDVAEQAATGHAGVMPAGLP